MLTPEQIEECARAASKHSATLGKGDVLAWMTRGEYLRLARAVEAATLATVTPLVQQREPLFYTVFCLADHQGAPLALPQYSHQHESGVLDLVLAGARREGFQGTAQERMAELGWRVGPVFASAFLSGATKGDDHGNV